MTFEETLSRYSKGIISLLVLAFAAVMLFFGGTIFGFHIEADFQAKVIALVPLAAGVAAVIGTKNATEDAIDKAIMQLVTGFIAVGQFFAEIPSDLGVKIGAFVYACVAAYFVWAKSNHGESKVVVGRTTGLQAISTLMLVAALAVVLLLLLI